MKPRAEAPALGPEQGERLHKYLARCGVASRRKAEELIQLGRVQVDGQVVRELGIKLEPGSQVMYEGRPVVAPNLKYVLMNKPKGVLTTMSDPDGRRNVSDLLPELGAQLKPVGRLDKDTSGLLIFTNDGELAMRLTHPRYGVEKEYEALVEGVPGHDALERLRKGVRIEGRLTAQAGVVLQHADERRRRSLLRLTVHEGRKRQIRLMCEAVGHPVMELKRIRIGPLVLRDLPAGACRLIGKAEVQRLRRAVGLGQ